MTQDEVLGRARQELDQARRLLEAGFAEVAASRAYYAALYAVRASLATVGIEPKTHSGALRAFGDLVRPGGAAEDPEAGRLFHRLERARIEVDYGTAHPSAEQTGELVEAASRVILAVERFVPGRDEIA